MEEDKKDYLKNEENNINNKKDMNEISDNNAATNDISENINDSNQNTKKTDNSRNNSNIDLLSSCQLINDELVNYDMSFKLILIGDSFVGKSCISTNASKNIFENYYTATVGFEFFSLQYKINSQNIRLQIWDTCGQEQYRSLIQNFYRNSSLAILVYSIDSKQSFENLEIWLNEIRVKGNPDVKIFLVGNKVDLEDKRMISTEEGKQFCDNHKLNFFIETSAKNGKNIQELFKRAAILLYKEHLTYTNMANKLENPIKITPNNDEDHNIWERDDEESERKKKCTC